MSNRDKYLKYFSKLNFRRIDLKLMKIDEYNASIVGGDYIQPIADPTKILNDINNDEYRMIRGENIAFYFNRYNNKISKNILLNKNSHYWEAGSNTVVFSINDMEENEYVLKVQRYDKNIIEEYINTYIEKYTLDFVDLLRSSCPEIYCCGKLITPIKDEENDNSELFYCVMKKYDSFFTYNVELTFPQSSILLFKMVSKLKELHHNNYYLRDLKFENIGFLYNDINKYTYQDITPIFIDYDPYLTEKYIYENDKKIIYQGNTFYPNYFIEAYKINGENVERNPSLYINMEVMGLSDIILILFFNPLINRDGMHEYISSLYNGGEFRNGQKTLNLTDGNNIPNLYKNQNIGDINKIIKFVNFISMKNIEDRGIENFFKSLLLGKEKGLMNPDYTKILSYDNLYTQLNMNIKKIIKHYFESHMHKKISEEIKTSEDEKKADDIIKKRKAEKQQLQKEIEEMKNKKKLEEQNNIQEQNNIKDKKENIINIEEIKNTSSVGGKKYKIIDIVKLRI